MNLLDRNKVTDLSVHWYGSDWRSVPTVGQIRKDHVNNNGWSDIGYHFIIDRNGNLLKGRDIKCSGAHTYGFNSKSIGVLLLCSPNNDINQHMLDTLINLFLDLKSGIYGSFTNLANIKGHRDYLATECPGEKIYNLLPAVRAEVKRQLKHGRDSNKADYKDHWAELQLKWMIDKGFYTPDSKGNINPDRSMTRAEFATVIKKIMEGK